jgi:hypothetical protein
VGGAAAAFVDRMFVLYPTARASASRMAEFFMILDAVAKREEALASLYSQQGSLPLALTSDVQPCAGAGWSSAHG